MRTTLLAILACTLVQSFGQQSFQLQPTDLATGFLSLRSIELVPGGDYICIGGYRPPPSSAERGFIARVSPGSASIPWTHLFEDGTIMWSVNKTQDGEFIASGQVIGGHGFIVRFSAGGTIIWRTEINGVNDIRCVAEAPDGHIWAGGSTGGRELITCLSSAGGYLWSVCATSAISSLITHFIPDGFTMLAFGSETYMPQAGNLQASIRRFDLVGTKLLHMVVGNNSGGAEALYDAIRLPSGGFALAMQYVYTTPPFAGRQEIGILYFDAGLNFLPSQTVAYNIATTSIVGPRIQADASSLYVFCTKISASDGGTIAFKTSLATGDVIFSKAVARGFSRTGKIIWNGPYVVLASSQNLTAFVGNPPETLADIAVVQPSTLERVWLACETIGAPPAVEVGPYFGSPSLSFDLLETWGSVPLDGATGPDPEDVELVYADCALTLPVELIAFTAEVADTRVDVHWTTASERESDYFDVERSADGYVFQPIGRVMAAGTSFQNRSYYFLDMDPLAGTSYYRLHQVDTNGEDSYSNVESVHFDPAVLGPLEYQDLSGRIVSSSQLATGMYIVHLAGSVLPGRKIWIEKTE